MGDAAEADEQAFEELVLVVRRLFHRLRATAEEIHGDAAITVAHRAVLESLYRDGPQTVPALARARPVSRQHIQVLVNRLLRERLVEAAENPAHKRSPVIRLTSAGRRRFAAMRDRERRSLRDSSLEVSARELRAATATLRRVAEGLAAADWSRLRRRR